MEKGKEAEGKVKAIEKMGSDQTEPWHKPKNGSIFPAKRRSVKRMMWDCVFGPKPDMGFKMGSLPSKSKKNKSVHAFSSQYRVHYG